MVVKQFSKSKIVLTVLLAVMAGQVCAENDSIDVRVHGQFVPTACGIDVGSNATVDYGTIKAETIANDDYTMLAVKSLPLTISCEAPVKIALHTIDMRGSSVVALTGKNWDVKVAPVPVGGSELGLGTSDGKKIGAWAMWMEPGAVKADGKTVDYIGTNTAGNPSLDSSWTTPSSKTAWLALNNSYKSWAAPGESTPLAFTTLSGTLSVQAGINKGAELDLNKAIHLDGMATIQVFYL